MEWGGQDGPRAILRITHRQHTRTHRSLKHRWENIVEILSVPRALPPLPPPARPPICWRPRQTFDASKRHTPAHPLPYLSPPDPLSCSGTGCNTVPVSVGQRKPVELRVLGDRTTPSVGPHSDGVDRHRRHREAVLLVFRAYRGAMTCTKSSQFISARAHGCPALWDCL